MPKVNKAKQNGQAALNRLVEMFEQGEMPQAIAKTVIQRQNGHAPSDSWSISNQMLMFLAGTDDARGFRQWEKVGRRVIKGSKAFHILGPVLIPDPDDETGQSKILVGFRGIPVFRVEDTEGDEVERPEYEPVQLPPLAEVAEKFGCPIRYAPFFGDAYGSYSLGSRQITLHTHDTKVFWHELAHAAHGKLEKLNGGQHRDQEVIAETVAAVLCLMYGGEGHIPHAAEYISAYEGDKAGKAVIRVLNKVQKVLDLILDTAEGAGLPAPQPEEVAA